MTDKPIPRSETRKGRTPDDPLPTLEWPGEQKPPYWWGRNTDGELCKVYRSYADYCD